MTLRSLLACVALTAVGCTREPPPEPVAGLTRFEGATMGTTYAVTIVDELVEGDALSSAVQAALDQVDASMSTYDPDSELSRLNRAPASVWVEVSPELATVVAEALVVSAMTKGAFDVTVGPLVRLWGFGAGASSEPTPPSPETLATTRGVIGFDKVQVRQDPPGLNKDVAGLELDLSGIAKGFAVDQVAHLLEARGFRRYLVEVGGEVRASGTNASGEPWRIGIETPIPGARGLQRTVGLNGHSMATSGDYRNFYEVDGVLFSHLIDPRQQAPVAHRTASVSVIHESCMRADALASGLLVLGADKGLQLAAAEDLAVLFLVRGEDGSVEERASPAFERHVRNVATMEP